MATLTFFQQLILKLLEWPFLLTAGLAVLVIYFRKELAELISRGGVSITWGDKSFSISELPEELNESFAPVTDDIEELKHRVDNLEEKVPADAEVPVHEAASGVVEAEAKKRMLEALEQGKYRWRSIERLASIAAISSSDAELVLRPLDEVIFSRGKSGRTIARLKSR